MGQRIGKSRRQTLRPIERSKTPWSWSWSWGKWGRSCLDSTAGVVCLPLSYSSITKLEEKKRASQLSTILSFWKQWRGWENKVRVRVCWCPGCTYGRIEKRKEGKKEGGKEGRQAATKLLQIQKPRSSILYPSPAAAGILMMAVVPPQALKVTLDLDSAAKHTGWSESVSPPVVLSVTHCNSIRVQLSIITFFFN